MRLGILLAGRVNEALVDEVGEVDSMFARIYRAADPDLEIETFPVVDGTFPSDPSAADAWLVTGSKFGVYDDLPWIAPLKQFLREARDAGKPMIGICFGHQIMAEAFGGRAEKSEKGWGVGVHTYEITAPTKWMDGASEAFHMHAMHQDQVTALPEDANVLASSPFCEFAMVSYGDTSAPDAISVQPHPEFTDSYSAALLDLRSVSIPADTRAAAHASIGVETDGLAFARWSLGYLRAHPSIASAG